MKRFVFFAFTLILSFSSETARAENKLERNPVYDFGSEIEATIENFHIPGMQIGLIVEGKVVLSRGYGYRNVSEKQPMTEHTIAGIGSLSKAFTTYILEKLVEEKKIAWDDPVVTYIPEFRLSDPDATQKMTVLDLAAHRTGIFRHDGLWYISDKSKLSTPEGLKLLPFLEPENKPREKFQYNNFMYSVLGLLIERVTGTPYEKAVSERIFKPLGMSRSSFSHGTSNYSLPYAYIEEELREIPFNASPILSVGGGIYSTVSDLLKWTQLHLKKGPSMKEMYTVQMPFNPIPEEEIRSLGYGLGWYIGEYRGYEHIYHAGIVDGFTAHLSLLPQKNVGLVVLTNSSSDGLEAVKFIQQVVFDKVLGLKVNHPLPQKKPSLPITHQDIELTPSLDPYVGDYSHPAYGLIQARILNGQLILLYGQKTMPLIPSSNNQFRVKAVELQTFGIPPWIDVTFLTNAEEKISQISFPFEAFRSGKPVIFSKN